MVKIIYYLFAWNIIGICSATNPLARIVHGDTVNIKDYPYQVSIRWKNKDLKPPSRHFCGGVIIDKNHILSAAHCFIKSSKSNDSEIVSPEEIAIYAGTSKLNEKGSVYEIKSITNHPDYDHKNSANDIAVLKLAKKIAFGDTQKPINLPSHNLKNESVGIVTGWGDTRGYLQNSTANELQKTSLIVLNKKTCDYVVSEDVVRLNVADTQFCAYSDTKATSEEYTGICSGDDGGPLVVENELVGIVPDIFVFKICGAGIFDLYTNVFNFLDFIEENSKN